MRGNYCILAAAIFLVAILNGCSLAVAVALAPVIGKIAEPIVEGVVAGIADAAKSTDQPPTDGVPK